MPSLPAWAWTWICLSVTGTWVLLNLIDAFSVNYEVSASLHTVMGLVAGGAGASGILKRGEEKRDRV